MHITDILERAIEKLKRLAPEDQEEVAGLIDDLAEGTKGEVYVFSVEEERALAESITQADRGEFATDEEVEAAFARFRR